MDLIQIVVFLLLGALAATWAQVLLVQHRLLAYLRDHHHDRWCYLTSIGTWGPGMSNGVRAVPYYFSEEDNDDPNVVCFKSSLKRGMLFAAGIFGVMLLIAVMIVVAVMTGILGT